MKGSPVETRPGFISSALLLVVEDRLKQPRPAEHVVHRRTLRPALDVLALVAREVSARGDVDGDLLQGVVPVRGLLRPRDRTRVDIGVGLHLELVELDASPGAVEDDRLRDARGQPEERGLDRLDAIVGSHHTNGVSDFLPRAHLNREVPGGLLNCLAPEGPPADLSEVAEPLLLPDGLALDAKLEVFRRGFVLLVELL